MQPRDPSAAGFCPPEVFHAEVAAVCQRCYSLTHYGRDLPLVLPPERYERELKQLRRAPGLVLQVVNIADLSGSFRPAHFQGIIGDHRTIVVANKVDLLPQGVQTERVRNWMTQLCNQVRVAGLCDVFVVSAKTGYGVRELLAAIAKHQRGRPIYCVGYANVGKSQLLRAMCDTTTKLPWFLSSQLESLQQEHSESVELHPPQHHHASSNPKGTTVSAVPGTTLELVSVTLPGEAPLTMIDTPGLIPEVWPPAMLPPSEAAAFVSPARIKPITYELEPGRALGIMGLVALHQTSGTPVEVTCFFPPLVKMHRGTSERVRAVMLSEDETSDGHSIESATTQLKVDLSKAPRGMADVALAGFGWVAIQGSGVVTLSVEGPSNMHVHLRKSPLMPFEAQKPTQFYGSPQRAQQYGQAPKKPKGGPRPRPPRGNKRRR